MNIPQKKLFNVSLKKILILILINSHQLLAESTEEEITLRPNMSGGRVEIRENMSGAIERRRQKVAKTVRFAVLLPQTNQDNRILSAVLPSIELAAKKVVQHGNLLSNFQIEIDYKDTKCSSTFGPLAAFDLYNGKTKPDVFFGPICDYVLAPVARYSGVWEIPVLTAGGLAEGFQYKVTMDNSL
jgi:Receptor family ligand binding region